MADASKDVVQRLNVEWDGWTGRPEMRQLLFDAGTEIERLRAALRETETKLDEWYKVEASLHAAMHHWHWGGS